MGIPCIKLATCSKSSSFRPRDVKAGEPRRMPGKEVEMRKERKRVIKKGLWRNREGKFVIGINFKSHKIYVDTIYPLRNLIQLGQIT